MYTQISPALQAQIMSTPGAGISSRRVASFGRGRIITSEFEGLGLVATGIALLGMLKGRFSGKAAKTVAKKVSQSKEGGNLLSKLNFVKRFKDWRAAKNAMAENAKKAADKAKRAADKVNKNATTDTAEAAETITKKEGFFSKLNKKYNPLTRQKRASRAVGREMKRQSKSAEFGANLAGRVTEQVSESKKSGNIIKRAYVGTLKKIYKTKETHRINRQAKKIQKELDKRTEVAIDALRDNLAVEKAPKWWPFGKKQKIAAKKAAQEEAIVKEIAAKSRASVKKKALRKAEAADGKTSNIQEVINNQYKPTGMSPEVSAKVFDQHLPKPNVSNPKSVFSKAEKKLFGTLNIAAKNGNTIKSNSSKVIVGQIKKVTQESSSVTNLQKLKGRVSDINIEGVSAKDHQKLIDGIDRKISKLQSK